MQGTWALGSATCQKPDHGSKLKQYDSSNDEPAVFVPTSPDYSAYYACS
jgi:hypothetical protein